MHVCFCSLHVVQLNNSRNDTRKKNHEYAPSSTLVPILEATLPLLINQRSPFHLPIQRFSFILSLTILGFRFLDLPRLPTFYPLLHSSFFSQKSWWKVQVSTLTSARELGVTGFSFRIIQWIQFSFFSLLFFFSFSCTNLREYLIYTDDCYSDLLFKDYQNDHKFTITTQTSTGVVIIICLCSDVIV